MKRKSFYAAILAAFSLLASCNKVQQLEPTGSSAGDFFKTVKVDLGAATKAVSESAVNDATLFVYQNNGKTGESILYHQVYGPGSTFEVDLLFSDQTTYTYDIKAYANMGELAAEGGEVLFTGESESGLQLHGQSLSVGEADASAVTVDMSRYVGKVTVSKVAVDWTNDHGQQDLKLVSVYLANVPGKVGGEPEYNVGGGFVSSAMDALIYRPVGSEIADGESYTTAQSMYGYAGTDCALVLECELAGEKMYYHVPYSPAANTHRAFRITIRQNGADTPLGELAQEAIEVSVVTLNVLGFEESDEDVEFGEKLDKNTKVYDLEQSVSCSSIIDYPEYVKVKITGRKVVFNDLLQSGSVVEGSLSGDEIFIPQGTEIGTLGVLDTDLFLLFTPNELRSKNEVVISGLHEVNDLILNTDQAMQFPKDPTPVPEPGSTFSGVAVYGVDGKLYTPKAWRCLGRSKDEAVGVAVGNGQYAYVIHPTACLRDSWASNNHNDLFAYGNGGNELDIVLKDFSGPYNTERILAAVEDGVLDEAPAAEFCANTEFAHGKKGYLWSVGEACLALEHMGEIYKCFEAIHALDYYDNLPSQYPWEDDEFWSYFWLYEYENLSDLKFFAAGYYMDENEQINISRDDVLHYFDRILPSWTSTQGIPGVAYYITPAGYWNDIDGNLNYLPVHAKDITADSFGCVHPVAPLGEYVDATHENLVGGAILCFDDQNTPQYYSPEEWRALGRSNEDAIGVAVIDGEHRFVVHATAEECNENLNNITYDGVDYSNADFYLEFKEQTGSAAFYYGITQNLLPYLPSMSFDNYVEASKDFNGATHTNQYYTACWDGSSDPSQVSLPGYIYFCRNAVFGNRDGYYLLSGYLMSAGEVTLISKYTNAVDDCLEAIGGIPMNMDEKMYMTSSICLKGEEDPFSWVWVGGFSNHVNIATYFDTCNIYVRAIAKY